MMRPVYLRWIAAIAALLLFVGCSSDSGTDTTIKQGDPNDVAFLAIKAEVGEVLDSLVDRSFNPLTNPWRFPLDSVTLRQDYGPFHPDDIVDYGYQDGWYNLVLGSFATAVNSVTVDSVMFLWGDNPYSSYDIHTTGIHVKSRITITYDGEELDYTEQSFYSDAWFSDVDQAVALVDADIIWEKDDFSVVGSIQTHDNFDITITLEDVQFERDIGVLWNDNTPFGGTVDLIITHTSEISDGSETTTTSREWSFDVTFSSEGTASIEVISNNTRWTYSDSFGS